MSDLQQGAAGDTTHEEEHHPKGTFLLLMLFLALVVGYWAWTYFILLGRA